MSFIREALLVAVLVFATTHVLDSLASGEKAIGNAYVLFSHRMDHAVGIFSGNDIRTCEQLNKLMDALNLDTVNCDISDD
ncbi:hypothetical protein BOW52_09915 [Solemya elarraichensis gill symbiont]|uniref:Uncharacterized protein n=1 Tax=Solemya elarraichensis gill symbiont TaxID=1918949 RepID=A0A1T2KYL3_9GAMM|nr:hypothetical protein BOW52_09915 [Solemya elarraichensis gill symbiont]